MLVAIVRQVVSFCSRHAWAVMAVAVLATGCSGYYAATHFAITTDINKLIAPNIKWREREQAYEKEFPGSFGSILVVVDAPTPELATEASANLAKKLNERPDLFHVVRQLDSDPFFAKNGLLFQDEADLGKMTQGLGRAAPIIGTLASDPSLRGLTRALSFGLLGVQQGQAKLDDLTRATTMSADTVERVLAGQPASFSWQTLLRGEPKPSQLRHLIEVLPILDFSALQPGQAASLAIRQAAFDLNFANVDRARVRLTGPVAMADEEFGTLQEGAVANVIGTIVIVLVILWLALHSPRIILAVFLNLVVGFAATAAIGLLMVGALNLISVAFAVLFVGLGVDFGIQFAVRYRSERFKHGDLYSALGSTAEKVGAPLTLAAAAVACGFLSFFPTDYKGVSELGQIAGMGMLLAYITSITVLPALLTILHPPGEEEAIGYGVLAPVDDFLARHRIPVIAGTLLVAIGGSPLLYYLSFDFNPINLRSPKVESVATFLDLRTDPELGANAINVVLPKGNDVAQGGGPAPQDSRGRQGLDHRRLDPAGSGAQACADRRTGASVADVAQHRGHRAPAVRRAEHRCAEKHRRQPDQARRQRHRSWRRCGQTAGGEPDQACGCGAGQAHRGRTGVRAAASRRADGVADLSPGRAGDACRACRRD